MQRQIQFHVVLVLYLKIFNASGQRDNPCMAPIVKQALRGIRRLKGTFQQGKTPVLLEDIEDIIDCMTKLDVPELQFIAR